MLRVTPGAPVSPSWMGSFVRFGRMPCGLAFGSPRSTHCQRRTVPSLPELLSAPTGSMPPMSVRSSDEHQVGQGSVRLSAILPQSTRRWAWRAAERTLGADGHTARTPFHLASFAVCFTALVVRRVPPEALDCQG